MMILFWLLIGFGIYYILNHNDYSNIKHKKINGNSPEDILKERYAKGEIEEEEYKKILNNIIIRRN